MKTQPTLFTNYIIKLELILTCLIGCLIVSYILYIRLILERLPRKLFVDITMLHLIIYGWLFALFSMLTIIHAVRLYRTKYPRNSQKERNPKYVMAKLTIYFNNLGQFYKRCLKNFDKKIIRDFLSEKLEIHIYRTSLDKVFYLFNESNYIMSYVKDPRCNRIIDIFWILPKIIILISLYVDVFIFKELHYFYTCGPLFILILILDYLLYVFADEAVDGLIELQKVIRVLKTNVKDPIEQVRGKNGEFVTGKFITPYEYYCEMREISKQNFDINPNTYVFLYTDKFIDNFEKEGYILGTEDRVLQRMTDLCTGVYSGTLIYILYFETFKSIRMEKINVWIFLGYAICWCNIFVVAILTLI